MTDEKKQSEVVTSFYNDSQVYNSDDAKSMRSDLNTLLAFIQKRDYEIFLLKKQYDILMKDYQKLIGVCEDDKSV